MLIFTNSPIIKAGKMFTDTYRKVNLNTVYYSGKKNQAKLILSATLNARRQ